MALSTQVLHADAALNVFEFIHASCAGLLMLRGWEFYKLSERIDGIMTDVRTGLLVLKPLCY